MTYSDYREEFKGVESNGHDVVEAGLNYIDTGKRTDNNEIYLEINANGYNAYVALPLENAVAFRDHLNFLIEKAAYVAPSEVVAVSDLRDYPPTHFATNVVYPVESMEFDAEKSASQINALWDALVEDHEFDQKTADQFVTAFIRSGGLNS